MINLVIRRALSDQIAPSGNGVGYGALPYTACMARSPNPKPRQTLPLVRQLAGGDSGWSS